MYSGTIRNVHYKGTHIETHFHTNNDGSYMSSLANLTGVSFMKATSPIGAANR